MSDESVFFGSQPLFLLDHQTHRILDANEQALRLYGYRRSELLEMCIEELGESLLSDVPIGGSVGKMMVHRTKEGRPLNIRFTFHPINFNGEPSTLAVVHQVTEAMEARGSNPAGIGSIVDSTDPERSFEKFKASVESFEHLFDAIGDAIYILDREGKFLEVNRGAVEMYGYSREEFTGKKIGFLAAPGKVDVPGTYTYLEETLKGEKQVFNWWGRRKNGEVFPKEVVMNPGTFFGEDVAITIARDITDRYEADEMLKKNEEMFRQLFQNAPIGIAMVDDHSEVRVVNPAFEKMFGYSLKEIQGLDIDKVLVPDGSAPPTVELFSDEDNEVISRRIAKGGSLIEVMTYGVPIVVNGQTISYFVIYVDVTERKKAEEQVKKSLREKEVLLAEIHHRVKNNLAVITGLLELQSYNSPSEAANRVLRESQMRISSIALIHEKLYRRKDLSQISFNVYIKELSDIIVKSLIKNEQDIELIIDAEPVELTINQAIPCGLILNELITNAYKHAFRGDQKGEIRIQFKKKGETVVMTVEDDGVGLPPDQSPDEPSSLGLTLIKTLSRQLDGRYEFKNKEKGTLFELAFDLRS